MFGIILGLIYNSGKNGSKNSQNIRPSTMDGMNNYDNSDKVWSINY